MPLGFTSERRVTRTKVNVPVQGDKSASRPRLPPEGGRGTRLRGSFLVKKAIALHLSKSVRHIAGRTGHARPATPYKSRSPASAIQRFSARNAIEGDRAGPTSLTLRSDEGWRHSRDLRRADGAEREQFASANRRTRAGGGRSDGSGNGSPVVLHRYRVLRRLAPSGPTAVR